MATRTIQRREGVALKMWRRLYADVFEGSMAGRKDALVLFMYLISKADDSGFVRRPSLRVVGACTGLTPEEHAKAIEELEAPDPDSRSKAHEGRRILPEDDGWLIVNFTHYQEIQREVDRRESTRNRVAKHRAKSITVTDVSVTPRYTPLEERRGEEKKGEEKKTKDTGTASRSRFVPPSLEEVKAYCRERRSSVDPQVWMDHYESNGWRVGRNPMKSWKAAVRTWEKDILGLRRGSIQFQPQQAPKADYSALEKARRQREAWEKENAR